MNRITVVLAIACAHFCLSSPLLSSLGAAVPGIGILVDTKALNQGLDFAGNLTEYATNMASNASHAGTHIARNALNSSTALGSKALDGGVKVAQQGLEFVKTASGHIPGYGVPIKIGATVGAAGLNVVNVIGQKGLNLTATGGDKALAMTNKVVQTSATTTNNLLQKGISLGKSAVGKMNSIKTSVSSKINSITGKFSLSKIFGSKVTQQTSQTSTTA